MATLSQTQGFFAGASAGERLGGAWSALAGRVARYRQYRAALAELAQLSDRDLADVGLHRDQIEGVAAEAAYGR